MVMGEPLLGSVIAAKGVVPERRCGDQHLTTLRDGAHPSCNPAVPASPPPRLARRTAKAAYAAMQKLGSTFSLLHRDPIRN
jgi:hypothetical protein